MLLYCSFVLLVYKDFGYAQLVDDLAEESMQGAVDEVTTLPYYSQQGEVQSLFTLMYMYVSYSVQ